MSRGGIPLWQRVWGMCPQKQTLRVGGKEALGLLCKTGVSQLCTKTIGECREPKPVLSQPKHSLPGSLRGTPSGIRHIGRVGREKEDCW